MTMTPFNSTMMELSFFGSQWLLEKDEDEFIFRFLEVDKYGNPAIVEWRSCSADELKNLMVRFITENYSFKRRTMAAKKKVAKKAAKKVMKKKSKKGC